MSKSVSVLVIASLIVSFIVAILTNQPITNAFGIGSIFGYATAILVSSVVMALIPAGIYWLFKRKKLPNLVGLIWFFWFVVVLIASLGNLSLM